ncbi:hypothetical protein BDM02DRAFT_2693786 [Thelephora ganbajun]|uniref:Uncharacterized protein n=1 Tax=Thelephora ganbajun TaxID=370292 RepID=A0ACB6ZD16_THEGA|nr:hypothetical protein BDM02DRAFT_2693786 [Thelephora ganbajun]
MEPLRPSDAARSAWKLLVLLDRPTHQHWSHRQPFRSLSLASLKDPATLTLQHPSNTVASPLTTSVRCPDPIVLETRFSTLTIVNYLRRLLDGGSGLDQTK